MNDFFEIVKDNLSRAIDQLLGRANGTMHLRLLLQPLMVTILSVKAGLKDAKLGHPPYFIGALFSKEERKRLLKTGWKAIGKVIIAAILLDVIYQLIVFHTVYFVQTLIVAIFLAVVPYLIIRGAVTRIAHEFRKNKTTKKEA
jgi:hypothetical protein